MLVGPERGPKCKRILKDGRVCDKPKWKKRVCCSGCMKVVDPVRRAREKEKRRQRMRERLENEQRVARRGHPHPPPRRLREAEAAGDDDEIVFLAEKSLDEVLAEQMEANKKKGNYIDITGE